MQKKILLLFMFAYCGVIGAKDSHTGGKQTVAQIVHDVRESDMSEQMGALEFMVKNLDEQQIQEYIEEKSHKLTVAERLLQEKDIYQYRKSNKEGFEAALVAELSGKADAIKQEFDKNVTANQAEEVANKAKEWNGSLGFTGSEPTKDSKIGRKTIAITSVKERKNKINQANSNLVNQNKNYVLNVLGRELDNTNQVLNKQYLRGFQVCGGDADCLGKRDIVWEDARREDFFENLTLAAYNKAVVAAGQMDIVISAEDIQKMAEKNPAIAPIAKSVAIAKQNVKNEVNKILNPTPTNAASEDKPAILDNKN